MIFVLRQLEFDGRLAVLLVVEEDRVAAEARASAARAGGDRGGILQRRAGRRSRRGYESAPEPGIDPRAKLSPGQPDPTLSKMLLSFPARFHAAQ